MVVVSDDSVLFSPELSCLQAIRLPARKNHHVLLIAVCALFLTPLFAKTNPKAIAPDAPPQTGNYSLPTAQQPGPFYSFGQDIVDKGNTQIFLQPSYQQLANEQYPNITAALNYGISDSLAVLVYLPVAVNYIEDFRHSSGIGDTGFQAEYAFYNASNRLYTAQATVLVAAKAPTGSARKDPETGYGTPSYFIGGTFNRTYVDWYWFVSPGGTWIAPYQNIHRGSQYYYQFGLGRNIASATNKYILFGLLEVDGEYDKKDKIAGQYDPDSGGNIVYMTPSLSYSTKQFIVQLGVSWPLLQQLNGVQDKIQYLSAMNIIWTFY